MKTEAHQRYQGDGGREFPGVTTVLGILDKPGLAKWANNLGLKGIDSQRFVTEAAEVGSLAHDMIMCHFAGKTCDTSDYSANQIKRANHSLGLFHKWCDTYKPRPILVEQHLVSHRFGYGGTIDFYGILTVAGKDFRELCDFKTGSGPWPSHFAQLAAYRNMLVENGYKVENCRLVKVPAEFERQAFAESQLLNLDQYWQVFLHCLAIYKMKLL